MTIEIPLTKGYIAIVDDEDGDLAQIKWHVSLVGPRPYARRNTRQFKNTVPLFLHRVILERIIGQPLEKGEMCDHANCNTLDCTRGNLRLASHTENMRNRSVQRHNVSGYKGVSSSYYKQGHRAQIRVNYKTIVLGFFPTKEDAARAYNEAALKYHGEFARLNVIYQEVSS